MVRHLELASLGVDIAAVLRLLDLLGLEHLRRLALASGPAVGDHRPLGERRIDWRATRAPSTIGAEARPRARGFASENWLLVPGTSAAFSAAMNASSTTISGRHYLTRRAVEIEMAGGRIQSVHDLDPRADGGDLAWIAPGLIDIQSNGYGGQEFSSPALTVDHVAAICAAARLWRDAILSDSDHGQPRDDRARAGHDRGRLPAAAARRAAGGRHPLGRALHHARGWSARRPSAGTLPRPRLARVRSLPTRRRRPHPARHAVARISRVGRLHRARRALGRGRRHRPHQRRFGPDSRAPSTPAPA